ncbi:amino acid adenylation enzyme/thioester reductase family protein [Desulfosporosinus acidiphilus SJ4]|uniref:Amino acid adenylation enzyme/thioester reductase family protein n=1 Tax=Desulfosporosinus acidiphilus (strain DSM 22704 / JCM 16185 / SJ4) TaxID=646529 RepID=I4D901_DESAJ|nr:D-alanine--poly(phosphoribitol) ligase subunit DltA [Desulfosporosinus acidiphilus]AFM42275.1 amino acid adenylation enzyme/thioester reductase family protein [Desulfosporosinus acidiphilus SJ4]
MLLQQIDHWAELVPQRLAHKNRFQVLTYAELKTFSDTLAYWLYQRISQLEKRAPIIVYGHKESEMLVLFLACLKAGHPYIPIDKSIPTERLLKIIESSGALAILSPISLPEKAKMKGIFYQENLHLPSFNLAPPNSKPKPEWKIGLNDVWYIIYTSGSTGEPKGVQITQRSLLNFITWVNKQYQPNQQEDIFLNQAPFSFDLSVMDLYMALSNGGTLWSIDKEQINNPKDLFASLRASQISYWISTPSFVEMCLMDPSFREKLLPKLRYFLFCGEVLPHNTASNLIERFPQARVVNLYGPTECTVAVTGVTITKQILQNSGPLPVGQDSADCQILICDPDDLNRTTTRGDFLDPPLKALPAGVRGEIVIVGPNVSIGYLNRPELTKRTFFMWRKHGIGFQGYRTGDLGYWLDGKLYYLGRQDFQIKLHGYRIELGEIEEQLRKIPNIENAIVVPIVRRGKNAALQAFIKLCHDLKGFNQEPESFQTEMEQQIRQTLERVLPAYMLPQRYRFIDSLPMTANGKVDRKALLQGG